MADRAAPAEIPAACSPRWRAACGRCARWPRRRGGCWPSSPSGLALLVAMPAFWGLAQQLLRPGRGGWPGGCRACRRSPAC